MRSTRVTLSPISASPPPDRQNEFGAAVQGPSSRTRHFFTRARKVGDTPGRVHPAIGSDAAELSGDFSQSAYTNPIYDPTSTTCSGNTCTRTPFPNNIISTSLMNSPPSKAMAAFLKGYLQQPNLSGDPAHNYIENRPQTDKMDGYSVKIDHNLGNNDRLFGRLTQQWVADTQWQNGTVSSNHNTYRTSNFGGGWDHIFSPTLMLSARAGAMLKPFVPFNRSDAPNGSQPASAASFKNVDQYDGMFIVLPAPISAPTSATEGFRTAATRSGSDVAVAWIKGNHSLKAGGQYLYQNRLQNNLFQQFNFNDNLTSSDMKGGKTGNSLASALLGVPYQYTGELPEYAEIFFRVTVWSGYLQDEWKVRRNLTVNWGLRYDYVPKIKPLNNRLSNAVDLFHQKYLLGDLVDSRLRNAVSRSVHSGRVGEHLPRGCVRVYRRKERRTQCDRRRLRPAHRHSLGLCEQHRAAGQLRPSLRHRFRPAASMRQNTLEGASWPWTTRDRNADRQQPQRQHLSRSALGTRLRYISRYRRPASRS